jgi:CubicO group peptidase (beta-lactamase class C family)
MRSLLVVRHGLLVQESYFGGHGRDDLNDVRSVTKTVMAMLVGIAVDRGLFGLDSTLGDLLPASLATLDAGKQAITVRNLLTMSSGFTWSESGAVGYSDWITAPDQIRYLTDRALARTPGSTFNYNSAAVHLLSVILATKSGMSTPQFADRYLFGPIGIARRQWEPVSGGFVNGGAGLDLRARDLARLGQLMLQDGMSGFTRVLPAGWMLEATRSRYDWSGTAGPLRDTNYGYPTWIERAGPHPAFFAWGYGGQFIYVVPDLDLVVVATTNWSGLGSTAAAQEVAVLDIIVNRVLPAV